MRKLAILSVVAAVLVALLFWRAVLRGIERERDAAVARARAAATPVPPAVEKQKPPAEKPAAEPNPLADLLNAPNRTIRDDLEVLNNLFVNFHTNFPRTGNPVGENAEITAALTGANSLGFAFVPKHHPAINAAGELCDRWGTPFRFHQLSGTQMEIRSAGPDRKFGTADDAAFAPWTKL